MHSWTWLLGDRVSTLQAAIYKLLFTPVFLPLSLSFFSSPFRFTPIHFICLSVLFYLPLFGKLRERTEIHEDQRLTWIKSEPVIWRNAAPFTCMPQKDEGKHEVENRVKLLIFFYYCSSISRFVSHKSKL